MPASKNHGPETPGFFPWEQRHGDALAKGIIDLVNAHKQELYRLHGLAGEVDGHGSDRINNKIKQMMRKFAMDNDLDVGIVQGRGGKGGKKAAAEGKKRKNDSAHEGEKKVKAE